MLRDCIVWPWTRDGDYSVKTGYQLLLESKNRGEALGSNSDNLRSFWKGIWKMQIPNKIKNFCWRACTESLPTLATCIGERWSPLLCAAVVGQAEKQFCMRYGSATKFRLAGVMPSWKWDKLSCIWAPSWTWFLLLDNLRKTRNYSRWLHGLFGADETNVTLRNIACHLKR